MIADPGPPVAGWRILSGPSAGRPSVRTTGKPLIRNRNETISPDDAQDMGENLPGGAPASPAADPAARARRTLVGVLVLLLVAAALMATFVRVPYFVFRPGSIQSLNDRVNVVVGERFEPTGEVLFTTVRQDATVNGWEWLEARLRPSLSLVDEDLVLGGRTRDENRSFNFQLMRVSKSTAVAVALRHLGVDPIRATGVGMAEVMGPSEGLLTTDDVILSMDGRPVFDAMDLVEVVAGGEARTVLLTLGAREDDPSIGFMGIVPQTRWEDVEDLPVDVLVNTGRVGGNSAGLALTLSILDLVTPGELTGGLRVATTGTIDAAGVVGPVGGVVQKVVAARQGGADLLLVPAAELEVARRHADGMAVEGVGTLEDALDALARHGGQSRDLRLPGQP